MSFENNDILQKDTGPKTPPEIDKYDTHKKWCLTKMAYLDVQWEKMVKGYLLRTAELSGF